MQRDPATVAQHLSADVLADRGGSWERHINKLTSVKRTALSFSHHRCRLTVQVQEHVGLEQIFGPCHLALRHTRAERHPEEEQQDASSHQISSNVELL